MPKNVLLFIGIMILSLSASAQNNLTIKIISEATKVPVESVSISVNNKVLKKTDKSGIATLQLNEGYNHLHFSSVGYTEADTSIVIPFEDTLTVILSEKQKTLEEVTIIASTRNNQRIENSPLKVEVLGREEMEEESSIKPGGIASILGDVSGVQIQQSSAISGNANVRIQGLDGRYTQILRDGMPLYDGFSGGFGILSIPPLDLKQVELIKGSASTLYGGGAIGGLVNIISRKPTADQQAVVSINQTTLKETNFNTYLSKRYSKFGYTFFGGYNFQKAVDVNKDGFSDVTDLNGLVLHPKLFFYPDNKTAVTVGYTGTFEKRNGGDMKVLSGNADAIHRYFEKNNIHRNSAELTAQRDLANGKSLDFKSSLSSFNRIITNSETELRGRQLNYFTELSLLAPYRKNNFVAGINVTGDQFKKMTGNIPLNNFSNNTIGIFIQNTWNLKDHTTIEAGLRNDYQFTYGNFLLPRFAIFHHLSKHWAARAGIGFGYKTPNALAPQITDYPIQSIQPLPSTIRAEKSVGYNAEINYKTSWGDGNELFVNQAFFLTQLNKPITATVLNNGDVTFDNMNKPVVSKGSDTYIRAMIHEWEIYAGYTLTFAERKYLAKDQFMPLTPKNRFAFTLVRDFEKPGVRVGIEGSYTGRQHRENYTLTPGYFFIAALIEKKLGKHFSIVLNGENILDYRQSKVEALYSGSIASPVFNPLWAPIDGRVINLSVKWHL